MVVTHDADGCYTATLQQRQFALTRHCLDEVMQLALQRGLWLGCADGSGGDGAEEGVVASLEHDALAAALGEEGAWVRG